MSHVICKLHCLASPHNTYANATLDSRAKIYFGLLVLPIYFTFAKSWVWRARGAVDINFETIDEPYFATYFRKLYEALPGRKRLTPRAAGAIGPYETTAPLTDAVQPATLLRLWLVAGPLFLLTWRFAWRERINLVKVVRAALATYAVADGYFTRYPCRVFITYSDDGIHPCRYIAFRQHGGRRLVAIQNGERNRHPHFAFGMCDVYYVFGEAYARLLADLRVFVRRAVAAGSLFLDVHFDRLRVAPAEHRWDVLFVDQGVHPYNGFSPRSGESVTRIFDCLNRFKQLHPATRLAYQLRGYGLDATHRQATLRTLDRHFTEPIAVLENAVPGDSYLNALGAEVVMTFESTLGFQAMLLGKKVLFVNFSGDPAETMCSDKRFQIDDPTADYACFEHRLKTLMTMSLDSVPAEATARYAAFDGLTWHRIATDLTASELE